MADEERESMKQQLRARLERTLDERIDRYLAVNHQRVIGGHHFSHASTECVDLYRDGYFHSCITVTQAVAEGIILFVGDRNKLSRKEKETKQVFAERLHDAQIITQDLVDAFTRIQRSFRNDFHHMNPPVAKVPLESLAKQNIGDLAVIEREIFGFDIGPNGSTNPRQLKYWDDAGNGMIHVYVRCS